MVLFAFCMPLGNFAVGLTLPLRILAAALTRMICHGLLGIDVLQQGTALLDANRTYNYDVAAACSGIHSLQALLALTTIFAMLALRSIWRRALMLLTTVPLAILCNVLRLVMIILAAQAFGQSAGNFVDQRLGFVTYLLAIGCLLGVAHWLREKHLTGNA
jgi:exosortase